MFTIDQPFDSLTKPAIISIPTDNQIYKLDVVENMGLGIWFTDTKLPSLILIYDDEEDALNCMKGFEHQKRKCILKVLPGGKGKKK